MDSTPLSAARHLIHGSARVLLAEALVLPTGLLTAVYLTRRLGPADYGLFTLASVVAVWLEWGIASFFSRATIQLVGEADDWKPIGTLVVRGHLVVSGSAAVALWLAASTVAGALGEPELTGYLRLFAVGLPLFSLVQGHRHILVGTGAFQARALTSASRWIARLLLIILLVELGLSVSGAILGSIGASLVELVVARCHVRPSPFGHAGLPWRRLIGYAVPLSLFALSLRIFEKLDLIMFKILGATAPEAGVYGAAQSLSLIPVLFGLTFASLLLSTLTRTLRAGSLQEARDLGRDSMRLVLVLLPGAALVAGASAEIVDLLFGAPFAGASGPLAPLILAGLAIVMIGVTTAILTAAGKPAWTFGLVGPLVPLALLGHLLLIPSLGMIGAALVTTALALLAAMVAVAAVHRIWRIMPPPATLARSVLVSGVTFGLAVAWPTPGLWLLLKFAVIALVIACAFVLLREFSVREILDGALGGVRATQRGDRTDPRE